MLSSTRLTPVSINVPGLNLHDIPVVSMVQVGRSRMLHHDAGGGVSVCGLSGGFPVSYGDINDTTPLLCLTCRNARGPRLRPRGYDDSIFEILGQASSHSLGVKGLDALRHLPDDSDAEIRRWVGHLLESATYPLADGTLVTRAELCRRSLTKQVAYDAFLEEMPHDQRTTTADVACRLMLKALADICAGRQPAPPRHDRLRQVLAAGVAAEALDGQLEVLASATLVEARGLWQRTHDALWSELTDANLYACPTEELLTSSRAVTGLLVGAHPEHVHVGDWTVFPSRVPLWTLRAVDVSPMAGNREVVELGAADLGLLEALATVRRQPVPRLSFDELNALVDAMRAAVA